MDHLYVHTTITTIFQQNLKIINGVQNPKFKKSRLCLSQPTKRTTTKIPKIKKKIITKWACQVTSAKIDKQNILLSTKKTAILSYQKS